MERTITRIMLLVLTAASIVSGQSSRETLNNQKVLELVRMGLSEALIVAKVQQSDCDCDTTTGAIAKLKASRVTDPVIIAMMTASRGSQVGAIEESQRPASAETSAVPQKTRNSDHVDLSRITEPGIYVLQNGQLNQIEPSIFSGSKLNPFKSSLTFGMMKTKLRAKVRGRSANTQLYDPTPVFYFVFSREYGNSGAVMAGSRFAGMSATSPAEFLLVEMTQKEGSREAVLGEVGAFTGVSMGARDKDVREYSFEKVSPGVYKVAPRMGLAPGEYSFYYAGNVAGLGMAGGKVFDFGIRINQ